MRGKIKRATLIFLIFSFHLVTKNDNYMPSDSELIRWITEYARRRMTGHDGSHDFAHIERVVNNAKRLLNDQRQRVPDVAVEEFVVEAGALLHEVTDRKYLTTSCAEAEAGLRNFLEVDCMLDGKRIEKIVDIVTKTSFSKGLSSPPYTEAPEFCIVQDADRLDALGHIGIVRCAMYAGKISNPISTPNTPSLHDHLLQHKLNPDGDRSFVDHFHHKLFRLTETMNTEAGKFEAALRTDRMAEFLSTMESE